MKTLETNSIVLHSSQCTENKTYPSALVTGGGALILEEPAIDTPADFSLSLSDGLSTAAAGATTGATLSAFLAFSPPDAAEAAASAAAAAAATAARDTTPVVDGAGDDAPALSAPTNEVKRTERALATGV